MLKSLHCSPSAGRLEREPFSTTIKMINDPNNNLCNDCAAFLHCAAPSTFGIKVDLYSTIWLLPVIDQNTIDFENFP